VRLQLSRWVKTGRLLQLRRGLYALAPTWRKVEPHPFLIANRLQRGSYVSLQSALAYHGVIPEHVPMVTSVGPGRPGTVRNSLGAFQFNHLAGTLLFGYSRVEIASRQFAFVASPEKALLDLVHLTPGSDSSGFLQELRLQNPASISLSTLDRLAQRSGKPKLVRAARLVRPLLAAEKGDSL
jgi:predicted transcriptional regulator of viral defense system